MDKETAKAINNISKRLNEVEQKSDAYFNSKIESVSTMTVDSYKPKKLYVADETCSYNGEMYICIVDCIGVVPTDKNHFAKISVVELVKQIKEREETEDEVLC